MGTHPAGVPHARGSGHDRVGLARRGEDPAVIARLRSGFVALGTSQLLPGYCLLIADADGVEHLTDLPRSDRAQFLTDLGLLGEALDAACPAWDPAFSRLDYEVRNDRQRYLHAHLFPRYSWEPVQLRHEPVWQYPRTRWADPAHALGDTHDRLIALISRELARVLGEAY